MNLDQLPTLFAGAITSVAGIVTLYLTWKKTRSEIKNADEEVGDRLRDDLIELFKAQNQRLDEQNNRLETQQRVIDELQKLINELRETNFELQKAKYQLEMQNSELMQKLQAYLEGEK